MRRSIPIIAAGVGMLALGVILWLRYKFVATGAESLGELGDGVLFSVLLRPISCFVDRPWLALLPAGVFIGTWVWLRSPLRGRYHGVQMLLWLAAAAWLLYAVYEWRMDQWGRTVTAPIRMDMLLVAPVLEFVSLVGLIASWRGFRVTSHHPLPSSTLA